MDSLDLPAAAWSLPEARALIPRGASVPFAQVARRGSMLLGLYALEDADRQQPHDQDELYIVATGTATFVSGDLRRNVGPGDAIFVAAREPHRFENFTQDFETWVIFYGPHGGDPPGP